MIEVTSHITLNENEIEEHFIRATGPGGQKVNKTETAVQIRFDARKCRTIPPDVYVRLKALAGRRMTAAGGIILTARRFAAQERNRAAAR
ncbi:MAG: aminoacyl-tRNA hydrolase, partial [Rhodospirillales bacterium]|nr:aminoacyl-tRNA hydrolase [Rhodospirillales bacterium]